jgi:hypothetical protein
MHWTHWENGKCVDRARYEGGTVDDTFLSVGVGGGNRGVRSGSVCGGFAAPDESDENGPSWDAKG